MSFDSNLDYPFHNIIRKHITIIIFFFVSRIITEKYIRPWYHCKSIATKIELSNTETTDKTGIAIVIVRVRGLACKEN